MSQRGHLNIFAIFFFMIFPHQNIKTQERRFGFDFWSLNVIGKKKQEKRNKTCEDRLVMYANAAKSVILYSNARKVRETAHKFDQNASFGSILLVFFFCFSSKEFIMALINEIKFAIINLLIYSRLGSLTSFDCKSYTVTTGL